MAAANQRLGEYILIDRIGAGTFGEVWRARHHAWADQIVAIKIPTDSRFVHYLQIEGAAIGRLVHPTIVKAIAFDPYHDPAYLVMEFVPGPNLRQLIQKGQLPVPDAVAIMKQVLSALHQAHGHGIIHRDIKPENILIDAKQAKAGYAKPGSVKLSDFGLGSAEPQNPNSIVYSTDPANTPQIVGSAPYMSPEQREGGTIDLRSDLYSCGIVLFEMLTGHRPAGAESPSEVDPKISKVIDDVFRKAYSRLDWRFESADKFFNALESALADRHAASAAGPDNRRIVTNSLAMDLVEIKPGTFLMGSSASEGGRYENEVQHKVALTKGFYMATSPLTQAQWKIVMGRNPSHFQGGDLPVEMVNYDNAQAFCNKLSEKEGKRYRLPTEAEWEYACRAGTTTAYYTGNGGQALDRAGWYAGNSDDQTHPVAQKKANAWGLYDMHGNVWQWCGDWYGNDPDGETIDPQGPGNGEARVLRGGSWDGDPRDCRSAFRDGLDPADRGDDVGFRLVLDFD